MAVEKCHAVARQGVGSWTVAGDTVVALGERILGKPADPSEAVEMLRALSGKTHQVISGWCVNGPNGLSRSGINVAQVRFRSLTNDEIDAYVATGEPMDKAGAYGIQGQGGTLVSSYEGDFSSIIGLPLADVIEALSYLSGHRLSESRQRLAVIRGRIEVAADMAGRKPSSVKLIAATKGAKHGSACGVGRSRCHTLVRATCLNTSPKTKTSEMLSSGTLSVIYSATKSASLYPESRRYTR